MTETKRHLLAALVCAVLAVPASAHASPGQESIFMDDTELVFGTDQEVEATFVILRALGVDRVRVSLLWYVVAPSPESQTPPAFGAGGASDPAAYPPGNWNIYDRVVNAAERNGIELLFTVTGPGPVWASSDPSRNDKPWDPSASRVRRVRDRGRAPLLGHLLATSSPCRPPPPAGLPILGPPPPPPPPPPTVLPRVSMWSIWNEPNQPGWLRPAGHRPAAAVAADVPRRSRTPATRRSRPPATGSTTYLLAETAPRGSLTVEERSPMRPLPFIRELYCVDRRLRPYTGEAARVRGCPQDQAGRERFVADHPGLFNATGFAHHPYALEVAPSASDPIRDQVTLAMLPRLTKTLDGIFAALRPATGSCRSG